MTGKEFQEKGAKAEELIHSLATESFFSDWCYLNPKLPSGKELCDILIVFDSIAIIWQIKNIKLHDGEYNESEVQKNLRQLEGARRTLFDLKVNVTLSNPRRGNEEFDPKLIETIFLISAFAGDEPNYSTMLDEYKGKKIHVFQKRFISNALNYLSTIKDFVNYLVEKERCLDICSSIIINGGEEDLLSIYLSNNCSLSGLDSDGDIIVDGGGWEALNCSEFSKENQLKLKISKGWDDIINRAHEAGGKYELIAREMARLTRDERKEISQLYLSTMIDSQKVNGINTFRRVVSVGGITFCFMFHSRTFNRAQREEVLMQLCYVARVKIENKMVIGICTELEIEPTCSYNFCKIYTDTVTDKMIEKASEIQKVNGILASLG